MIRHADLKGCVCRIRHSFGTVVVFFGSVKRTVSTAISSMALRSGIRTGVATNVVFVGNVLDFVWNENERSPNLKRTKQLKRNVGE